jgi:hypothetical protein
MRTCRTSTTGTLSPCTATQTPVSFIGRRADRGPKGEFADPGSFSLQTGRFLRAATGAMMPIADPSGRHPPRLAPPCWRARAMPSLWQYFSRLLKSSEGAPSRRSWCPRGADDAIERRPPAPFGVPESGLQRVVREAQADARRVGFANSDGRTDLCDLQRDRVCERYARGGSTSRLDRGRGARGSFLKRGARLLRAASRIFGVRGSSLNGL